MQQNAINRPGNMGSSELFRCLITALGTRRGLIPTKTAELNVESTCLPLGGMIKAMLPEITHIDSVGPEPGVGYGLSWRYPGLQKKKNDFEKGC